MGLPALTGGRRKSVFLRLLLVSFCEASALFLATALIKSVVDDFSAGVYGLVVMYTGVALIAVALLLCFCHWSRASLSETLGMDYVGELRLRLFSSAVFGANAHRNNRLGSTMARMLGDLSAVRDWVAVGLPALLVSSATLIAACAALLAIDWHLGWALFALLSTCYVFFFLYNAPALREKHFLLRRLRGRLSGHLADLVNGAATINYLKQAERESKRIEKYNDHLLNASVQKAKLEAVVTALPTVTVVLAIGLVILVLASGYQIENKTTGTWSALLFALGFLAASASGLVTGCEKYIAFQVARVRILELLSRGEIDVDVVRETEITPSKALSLKVEPVDQPLGSMPLIASDGDNVLLLGVSGSGKTSFLKMMLMPDVNDKASVFIDDVPVTQIKQRQFARSVQLVSPSLPLLRGSAKRNMTYGKRTVSDTWLKQVLEICQLEETFSVEEMQSFRVKFGGENLASGLAARMRLARALVTQPGLLLVDDPAFLYDPTAQQALVEAKRLCSFTLILTAPEQTTIDGLQFHRYWYFNEGDELPCASLAA